MLLRQIFDSSLAQYAYLIGCQRSGEALIIDPERDIDRYRELAAENGLRITAVAETHIHADFVSGAQEFAADPSVHLYLSGEGGAAWSYQWGGGRANTHLVRHGDRFAVGRIEIEVVHTPGHTPEHICFLVTDRGSGANDPLALITGDFLFAGDVGRPDLLESAAGVENVMEQSARTLQTTLVDRLASLPDFLQILPGHGAGSACGKSLGAVPMTTLGYERRMNHAFRLAQTDAAAFVADILHGQPNPPLYFATMKRVNRDGVAVTGGVPRGTRLSPDALRECTHDRAFRIIDARMDSRAFGAGHVPRSLYAPLRSSFFAMAAGSFVDATTPLGLIVENESDAELAARQLYRIGLDGLRGWLTVAEAQAGRLMTATTARVDFADFDRESARREGAIIDVRTTAEFTGRHLEGAVSMPYTRLRALRDKIPTGHRLFVHCASGKRAALASAYLTSEGFDVVHVDGSFAGCGTRCGSAPR